MEMLLPFSDFSFFYTSTHLFICFLLSFISQIAQSVSHVDWFTHYSCGKMSLISKWFCRPTLFCMGGWGLRYCRTSVSLDRSSMETMTHLFVSKYCPLRWGWLLCLWLEILSDHYLTVVKIKPSPTFSSFDQMSNSPRLPWSLRSLRTLPLFQLIVDKLDFVQPWSVWGV